MGVRAKFVCSLKNENMIAFNPVYSGSKENETFFRATPGGQITLNIVNEAAAAQFEQGKEYYVDFTPANQPQQVQTSETQITRPPAVKSAPQAPQSQAPQAPQSQAPQAQQVTEQK